MKRKDKPNGKVISLHVYGILDKKAVKIHKVSLDREELEFEIELDNIEGNLILCDFELKVAFPI